MNRIVDLTGKRSGRLTAISATKERTSKGNVKWLCKCDCGTDVIVSSNNFNFNQVKSCGCLHRKDIAGMRFGRLTVISATQERSGSNVKWLCKCDCGTDVIVASNSLHKGLTQSCGCKRVKNITGMRFGRLVAISETKERTSGGNVKWLCKCDCGNDVIVDSNSLNKGNTKSCGCLYVVNNILSISKAQLMSMNIIPLSWITDDIIEARALMIKINREIRKIDDEKY